MGNGGWVLAASAVLLTSCGMDEGSSTTRQGAAAADRAIVRTDGSGTTEVQLDVRPGELEFVSDEVEVPAGRVTFASRNPDELEHNIAIKGPGVDERGELVSNGTSRVTAVLVKGRSYVFYCVPHENAPMRGTITVT